MKKISILLILFLHFYHTNAQKMGNIWYFGNGAGLDFNSGSPVVLTNGAMFTNEGCSAISDCSGSLLFYTDGSTVWNKNHLPMPNGTGLTGNFTSTQSAMIIQQPNTPNIYYIFSLFNDYSYSIVDMTLNGGLGDVTAAKNVMIMSGANTEKQSATRHANGTDAWIMLHAVNSFYAYQLTTLGFNAVPIQSTIGLADTFNYGQMKFSHQGNRIAFGIYNSVVSPNICLLDFDNSTGIVSNNIDISNGDLQCYGVEFSPDGSKLYATVNYTSAKIQQYDLNAGSAADIIASQIEVGSSFLSSNMVGLQTGPDKKLYICLNYSSFLAVINDPDSLGLACNYVDAAVNLGRTCQLGLPEFISDYYYDDPNSFVITIDSVINNTCDNAMSGSIWAANGYAYIWNNGTTAANATGLVAGTYTVTATNGSGCTSSVSQTITTPIVPTLNAYVSITGMTSVFIPLNTVVTISAGSTGFDYIWTSIANPITGNANIANNNQATTTVSPNPEGVYTYIVTASATTSNLTCIATDTVWVTVEKFDFRGMPTAFTPNGDGYNDYFAPVTLLDSQVKTFRVYNRWLQEVYNGDNAHGLGWDGKYLGVDQPSEVYMYLLTYQKPSDPETKTIRGEFMLMR